ncbi:DUF2254 domain-containing protein [Pedobacter endophyticus]|nr:DUF2254 domain-containing protein [Pedobacter endophyticus]
MNVTKWLRVYYNKITESIAFYPALIAIGFLLLSWGMLEIDFSEWGKELKSGLSWLSLKDASTARSIISTVAGALISLTVFSFSMVMIVLNQAASQMSNRVLTSMIENRFQQMVLGFYIGTIVYALFLLSTIRDVASGIYVPALSIYLLIFLTVIDIFLFIYFLDYVTQTVKYETVIDRVRKQTLHTMKNKFEQVKEEKLGWDKLPYVEIKSEESDYFQNFNEKKLLKIASKENLHISFLYKQATFLVKGMVFIRVYSKERIEEECLQEISSAVDFYSGQPIDKNADYGFRQLAEIAIKALSPGINDPGTAVIALNSLSNILSFKLYCNLPEIRKDDENIGRIHIPASSFQEMFERCIYPIWNYGKNDEYIQYELLHIIEQLKLTDFKNQYAGVFAKLMIKIENHIQAELDKS